MMLSKYILAIAALGVTSLTLAQEPRQPCGVKLAACPSDQQCSIDAKCISCPRHCEYKNKYMSCGGKRINPVSCPDDTECRDDPRLPPSCGLACDKPGICTPKKRSYCGGIAGFVCPKGKFCYGCEKPFPDCMGECL